MTTDRAAGPLIIGIAGGSGSGKTTIAQALADEIGAEHCLHILHDAYYRDLSHLELEMRAQVNYDHPDSLETELLVEHLQALMRGNAVEAPRYDFAVHNRCTSTDHLEPRPVILVEGVLALAEPALRNVMALKIYVDTDSDLRFMRRLERDLTDRGRTRESVYAQYLATVRPMHMKFVEPSKAHADLVIPEGYNIGAVSTVLGMVREFLRER
jgi:uridine kinase